MGWYEPGLRPACPRQRQRARVLAKDAQDVINDKRLRVRSETCSRAEQGWLVNNLSMEVWNRNGGVSMSFKVGTDLALAVQHKGGTDPTAARQNIEY